MPDSGIWRFEALDEELRSRHRLADVVPYRDVDQARHLEAALLRRGAADLLRGLCRPGLAWRLGRDHHCPLKGQASGMASRKAASSSSMRPSITSSS
jgi:hypothetical protein